MPLCPQPWAQNAWTETRPRGPIAAMYASPGPAYGLPPLTGYNDHDARSGKRKEPAWSFGLKNIPKSESIGPGPAAYEPGGNTRHGGNGAPAYSLAQKLQDPSSFKTPGPGTYSPEEGTLPSGSRKPPAWSLADRTGKDNNNNNPAPNAYNMPAMIGRKVPNKANSPGVPMGLKLKDRMNEDQPGVIPTGRQIGATDQPSNKASYMDTHTQVRCITVPHPLECTNGRNRHTPWVARITHPLLLSTMWDPRIT